MSWASEFQARMTAPELSENLQESIAVHSRHRQLEDEMKTRVETDFAMLVRKSSFFSYAKSNIEQIIFTSKIVNSLKQFIGRVGKTRYLIP